MSICVNKTDCDTAYSKQSNVGEIFNKMTSWGELPQPAEKWWKFYELRMVTSEKLDQRFQSSGGVSILSRT